MCLIIKHLDKYTAYGFALFFGIGQAGQGIIKTLFGINTFYIKAHVLVRIQYRLKFILTQQGRYLQKCNTGFCRWHDAAVQPQRMSPHLLINLKQLYRRLSFSLSAAMVVSTNESGVQSCLHPQMSTKKFCSNCLPSILCVTSGMELYSISISVPCTRKAATFTLSVLAIISKLSGIRAIVSACDIHTCESSGMSLNNLLPLFYILQVGPAIFAGA